VAQVSAWDCRGAGVLVVVVLVFDTCAGGWGGRKSMCLLPLVLATIRQALLCSPSKSGCLQISLSPMSYLPACCPPPRPPSPNTPRRFRNPRLERVPRELMFRKLIEACKRTKACHFCGGANGTVKCVLQRVGLLCVLCVLSLE
jgi:hypothetical protein